jgi:tight adherence protein B
VLLIAIFIFIAAFLLLLALYLNYASLKESPKYELKRRLRQVALSGGGVIPQNLRTEIIKETPPVIRLLSKVPLLKRLDGRLDRSGLNIALPVFLLVSLGLGIFGFLLLILVTKKLILSIIIGGIFLALPFIFMEYKKKQREDRFTELFPDALTIIARSIRSGHSFTSSIQLVGQEVSDPVGSLFKMAYDQQLLGLRINDTLDNLNNRIDSLDLRFFTTATLINSEVGGNFAEILDKLADTIRERIKVRRQLRVHTAQGRLSGYILAVLPIVVYFLMDFMIPGYQDKLLQNDTGKMLLIAAAVMQVIGFLIIRRIINIRI